MVAVWKLVVFVIENIKYHVYHVQKEYVLERLKRNFVRFVIGQRRRQTNERLGNNTLRCNESSREFTL